jgi:TRAP-type transport system periplasmic protein
MSTKKSNGYAICLLIFSLLFFTGPATSLAKTIKLKFAHPYPAMHAQHKGVLVPWAKKVEEACHGALKIQFIPGGALGKPGQAYAMVEKNVADIGWDIADYSPGRFPLTTVIELPFMVSTAEKASVALWKTYEQFPEFQKEYADTKLLMLSAHAPGFFATVKKPIKSLADLDGMKIKTASSFTTAALQLFGAVPVTQPVTETYTSLERGVLDGVVMPYDGIVIFKVNELLKYYTPADFYSMVFWVAMNKKKFESLPEDIKKVIEENSGLPFSRAHGKSFDESYASMKQICIKTGMQEVNFPETEMQKLIETTAPLKEKWVKEMEAKGLPGKSVLEAATRYLHE